MTSPLKMLTPWKLYLEKRSKRQSSTELLFVPDRDKRRIRRQIAKCVRDIISASSDTAEGLTTWRKQETTRGYIICDEAVWKMEDKLSFLKELVTQQKELGDSKLYREEGARRHQPRQGMV